MKRLFPYILFGFAFSLACDSPPNLTEQTEKPDSKTVDAGSFDLELFRSECTLTEGNVIISPFSISNVTKMILSGAYGETEQELLDAYRHTNKTDLLKDNKITMAQLAGLEKATVNCVNAFYYDMNAIEPTVEFKNALANYFAAEEKPLDFADKQAALNQINSWANTNTNGRIPTILSNIESDEVMFLLNAIYLKASWASPFDPDYTRDDDFTLSNGNTVTASYMYQDADFNHSEFEDGEMLELGYENNEMSLFLIKPVSGKLDEYLRGFSLSTFNSLLENRSEQRYMLYLPKFTIEYKNENMKSTFELMDIKKMFTPSAELDFCTPSNTAIGRIVHKTYFMIDEKGTEGAAVTAGGVVLTSMPPTFSLDHPFMFVLRHNATGQVLFIGRVENPVE